MIDRLKNPSKEMKCRVSFFKKKNHTIWKLENRILKSIVADGQKAFNNVKILDPQNQTENLK